MASEDAPVNIGTDTHVTFNGTLGAFTTGNAELLDVQITQSRKMINVTHMGTSNWDEFLPGDLADPGQVVLQFHFDPDDFAAADPIIAAAESLQIQFPGDETFIANGFVTDIDISVPLEDKMVVSITFKYDGITNVPAWVDTPP